MTSQEANCYLCDTFAKVQRALNDVDYFSCPNCGEYGITEEATYEIKRDKYKFSAIIKERFLKGLGQIIITRDSIDRIDKIPCMSVDTIAKLFPNNPMDIINSALMNLGNSINHPGDTININENSRALLFSRHLGDINYVLRQLCESNFISSFKSAPCSIHLEANGWERIETLRSSESPLNQAFVAMWFDSATESLFEKAILPAVEHDKVTKCMRIDKTEHNNKICDQIIAEIRKSRYLIADFTGNRGGVYFEAGFALGLGIPVIWLVHKNHLDKVHFDTRQYNYVCYDNEEDLLKKLKSRIEATIPKVT